jgi:hypothetical protein
MPDPTTTVPEPGTSTGARPAEIDPSVLRRGRRELGVSALPVIFDLPPPVAVKRADHFARYVHPVLQSACTRCHNENQPREFQLIQVTGRRAPTGNTLRANLDATLHFIDPQNPSRSDLLTLTLMPHGQGPNPKPVFRGSNDPRFQILAAWVNSLRTRAPADASVSRSRFAGEGHDGTRPDPGFASDRGRGPSASATAAPEIPAASPRTMPDLGPAEVLPSVRYVPGRPPEGNRRTLPPGGQMAVEEKPPSPAEFPVPYMLGGPPPKLKGAAADTAIPMPGARSPAAAAGPLPGLPPGSDSKSPSDKAKLKKPIKIDPELLEKTLLNRNGAR